MILLTFIDSINDYMARVGMDDLFSQSIVLASLFISVTILATKLNAPYIGIIFINGLIAVMAIILGWIPMWVVLVAVMAVMLYIMMLIFSSNSEGE